MINNNPEKGQLDKPSWRESGYMCDLTLIHEMGGAFNDCESGRLNSSQVNLKAQFWISVLYSTVHRGATDRTQESGVRSQNGTGICFKQSDDFFQRFN